MQENKSELRKEIEELLKRHDSGLTCQQLADRTGADVDQVRSVLGRLRDKLKIRSLKPSGATTRYLWFKGEPDIAPPNRTNKMDGTYIQERDNPSSPRRPGADQHEQCGSRIGDIIFYRDKTISYVK